MAIILLGEGLIRSRNRGVRSKRYKPQAPNPQTAIGVSREGAAGLPLRPCYPLFGAVSSDLVDAFRDEKLEHDDLEHCRYWKGEQGAEKTSQRSSNQEATMTPTGLRSTARFMTLGAITKFSTSW